MKKVIAKTKKSAPKRVSATKVKAQKKTSVKVSGFNKHAGVGVHWYGIHIHHIGLGVAAVGTLVLVLLLVTTGFF